MSLKSIESIRDVLVDCLSQQVSEFDLLKSMYPKHDEILLTDEKILMHIDNFLTNKSEYTPAHLDFILNLFINDLKLEVFINLPNFYPKEEPDIYLRCNQLNRLQETKLNAALSNYIKDNHSGEVCLYTAISWLQENIDGFSQLTENESSQSLNNELTKNIKEEKFERLWIYSHHIYNKKKREEIYERAKQLNITGFCLPGKPGIICIEGLSTDCKVWWRHIKSMNWKKIVIRKTEIFELCEQTEQQKFKKFEEIHFQNPSPRHSKHADMSGFSKYMEDHGLIQTFNDFFGLCNDI